MADSRGRSLFHEIVLPDILGATNRNLVDFLGRFVQPRTHTSPSPGLDELFEDDIQLQPIKHSGDADSAEGFFSWDSFTEAMEARHQRGATDLVVDS